MPSLTAPSWLDHFEPGSPLHWATALACTAAIAVACVLGRRWRATPRERALRWAWIAFVAAWQVFDKVWWVAVAPFDPAESLPLHLCDLAALLAPIALATQHRTLRAVLYFWAIALSTQAFFTPTLGPDAGLASTRFWLFWIGHTQIIGSACYDVVALGFRPTARDYVRATAANVIYGLVIIPVDIAFDLNYGYLGPATPDRPTILDAMPPWPWRLAVIFLLTQSIMAALWLVWPAARALGLSRGQPPSAPPVD